MHKGPQRLKEHFGELQQLGHPGLRVEVHRKAARQEELWASKGSRSQEDEGAEAEKPQGSWWWRQCRHKLQPHKPR